MRKGQTVISRLPLKRGSNTVIAVGATVIGADRWIRMQMLGGHLASLLRADAEYCGTLFSGTAVWTIGKGRPVFLRPLEENDRLQKWYVAMGEPVGPDREFWSVTIDWRGADETFVVPGGTYVIPKPAKVVHGRYQWPDGNKEEITARVAEAGTSAVLSDAANNLRDTYRFVTASLPSAGATLAIAALGAGLGAAYLLFRGRSR